MAKKPSPFAAILAGLPPAPPDPTDTRQGRIDARKAELTRGVTHTPESLARDYATVKRALRLLKAQMSTLQVDLDALGQLLAVSWDSDEPGWGLYGASPNRVRLADGACIQAGTVFDPKVVDKELYRLWCIDNGLEKALMLWPSTTVRITRERLEAILPAPDGVEAHSRVQVKFIKSKDEPALPGEDEDQDE